MLAADRSLLEVNLRQSAIKLREKELNLFTENFNSMSTQAAVLAGFTTTCLIELTIPDNANVLVTNCLHIFSAISISANITCVSISTMVSIWGSGKALRGRDGSMDEAVDGMLEERTLIFKAFALGLFGNLCTVLFACWVRMSLFSSLFATTVIGYTMALIYTNFLRIQKKFHVPDPEAVRLDDLTQPGRKPGSGSSSHLGDIEAGGQAQSVELIQRQIEQLILMQQQLVRGGGGGVAGRERSGPGVGVGSRSGSGPGSASGSPVLQGSSGGGGGGVFRPSSAGSQSHNSLPGSGGGSLGASNNSGNGSSNNGSRRGGGGDKDRAIEELFSLLPSSSRPPASKYNV